MSVGSDNFGSSDLTSYYCLNCDSRHELELDASPFVCDIKYSSDEELGNIVPLNTMQAAHQQTCVIINAPTGAEIPAGERTPHANDERRQDDKASGSNAKSTFSVSQEEWDAARNAVVNNTCFPIGVSAGTLNAYHIILEKNRSRLDKEQADLDRRWQAADLSSKRRRGLSSSEAPPKATKGLGGIARVSPASRKETQGRLHQISLVLS
jgi:hypothetical protein